MTTTTTPALDLLTDATPRPADMATAIALTGWDDTRVVVRFPAGGAKRDGLYSDDWFAFTDALTGRNVEIRRADCGAGCKCAAEVRVA